MAKIFPNMTLIKVLNQTRTFKNAIKKLHKNQKKQLDQAIKQILADPKIGELKKGDLAGIRVYKLKIINQLTLIAYLHEPKPSAITLLAIGSHENFYRDLSS